MADIVLVSLLLNLDRSHNQWNSSSMHLKQTFVCSVDVQLVLKNIRRNKRVYTKSEKIPEANSALRNRS